jgi:hypothetical protein
MPVGWKWMHGAGRSTTARMTPRAWGMHLCNRSRRQRTWCRVSAALSLARLASFRAARSLDLATAKGARGNGCEVGLGRRAKRRSLRAPPWPRGVLFLLFTSSRSHLLDRANCSHPASQTSGEIGAPAVFCVHTPWSNIQKCPALHAALSGSRSLHCLILIASLRDIIASSRVNTVP